MAAAAIAAPRFLYGGTNLYTTDFHMDALAASSAPPSAWSWTFVYRMAGTWMQILALNSELEGTQQVLAVQASPTQAVVSEQPASDVLKEKENGVVPVEPEMPSAPSTFLEKEASDVCVKDVEMVANVEVNEDSVGVPVPTVPECEPPAATPVVAPAAEAEIEVPVQATPQSSPFVSSLKRKHSATQEPTTRRRPNHIVFNETVMVVATYSTREYNREGVAKTVFTSRKELEKFVREMTTFKCYEMEVHPDSRQNTHFYRQITDLYDEY